MCVVAKKKKREKRERERNGKRNGKEKYRSLEELFTVCNFYYFFRFFLSPIVSLNWQITHFLSLSLSFPFYRDV